MSNITNDGLNHPHTVCGAVFYHECPKVKNYKCRLKPSGIFVAFVSVVFFAVGEREVMQSQQDQGEYDITPAQPYNEVEAAVASLLQHGIGVQAADNSHDIGKFLFTFTTCFIVRR